MTLDLKLSNSTDLASDNVRSENILSQKKSNIRIKTN